MAHHFFQTRFPTPPNSKSTAPSSSVCFSTKLYGNILHYFAVIYLQNHHLFDFYHIFTLKVLDKGPGENYNVGGER